MALQRYAFASEFQVASSLKPAPGLRRPRIPSIQPTMSNSRALKRWASPPARPGPGFPDPVSPTLRDRPDETERHLNRPRPSPAAPCVPHVRSGLFGDVHSVVQDAFAVDGAVYMPPPRACPYLILTEVKFSDPARPAHFWGRSRAARRQARYRISCGSARVFNPIYG